MKIIILSTFVLLCSMTAFNSHQSGFPKLTGPCLGQRPPGMKPEIFTPGIVSTKEDEYALEISSSGN
jgi:hypothetical protein